MCRGKGAPWDPEGTSSPAFGPWQTLSMLRPHNACCSQHLRVSPDNSRSATNICLPNANFFPYWKFFLVFWTFSRGKINFLPKILKNWFSCGKTDDIIFFNPSLMNLDCQLIIVQIMGFPIHSNSVNELLPLIQR